MSQGNDFANYSAAAASGSNGSEDVWFVAVASDDIKQMSVDQLDEAFRLGVITAETAVWTEGMEAWAPLGQVADLDGNAEETSGSVPVAGGAHASHRHEEFDSRHERHQAPATLPPVHQAPAGQGGFSAAQGGFATLQSAHHSFAPGPSSISPVTSSYAPSAGSSGPVALNVDEDMPAIRHGRRFRPERWALAAAAIVAIGVVGYNNMFSSSVASAGTQAPAAAPAAAPVSRGYDSADGVEPGEKQTAKASATETEAPAPAKAADEPSHAAAPSTKAAAADDAAEEAPATTKKGADKESLKGSFSKAFNKKAPTAKAAKVKPRSKAAARATTKARATKSKKPGVARSQSAFDPLNDSLP